MHHEPETFGRRYFTQNSDAIVCWNASWDDFEEEWDFTDVAVIVDGEIRANGLEECATLLTDMATDPEDGVCLVETTVESMREGLEALMAR